MVRRSAGFVSKRPHKKSRGGCLTCKKKKVKCDEKSPACGYCTLRKIDCTYPQESRSPSTSESSASPPKSLHKPSTTLPSTDDQVLEIRRIQAPTCLTPGLQTSSGTLSPIAIQLMGHYRETVWRTMSWRTEPFVAYLNRDWVPSKAIKNDYLLYAVLAISAAHLNAHQPDPRMKAVNLSYRQKALNAYAKALSNITSENYETILMCSMYMMGMVQPPERPAPDDSYFEWMSGFFQMMQGLRVLAGLKWAAGIEKLEIYPVFRREIFTLPPPPTTRKTDPSDTKLWPGQRARGDDPMMPNPPDTYGGADTMPTPESTPSPSPPQRHVPSGTGLSTVPYRPRGSMSTESVPRAPKHSPPFLPPSLMAILQRLVHPPSTGPIDIHAPTLIPAFHAISPLFLSLYYYHLTPDLYVRIIVLPTFLPPQFFTLFAQKEPRAMVIVSWWLAFIKFIPGMWWLEPEVLRCVNAISRAVMMEDDGILMTAIEGAYKIIREVDEGGKTMQSRERAGRTVFENWDGVDWDEGPSLREEWRHGELAHPLR